MRLYTFTNYYLSDIQRGIQTAHVVHELFTKYPNAAAEPLDMLYEWATSHKTIIVLNGGNSRDLETILISLEEMEDLKYPYTSFREDEQSLNGALTCVGVVVPSNIIAFNDMVKQSPLDYDMFREAFSLTPSGVRLATLIKSYPLA